MIQGYFVQEDVWGYENLYIMNKALKTHLATWLQNMATEPRLCRTANYRDTVLYKWFPPVYNGCIWLDYIFI